MTETGSQGLRPRRDISGYRSEDLDLRVVDPHYRNICEWAVGRNAAAAWNESEESARVTHCGRTQRQTNQSLPYFN
jgi:hypothetical protein